MAYAVVVVEGKHTSGALITARQALDEGKDVFAVPGSIRNPYAEGPNDLLRASEAYVVTDVQHIFDHLSSKLVFSGPPNLGLEPRNCNLTDEEVELLLALDDVPNRKDVITRTVDLPEGEVGLTLARLEVRGFVRRGKFGYILTEAGSRARAGQAQLTRD